ncbi:TraB/GumN family protein [Rhodobacteraceae bacterium B1Z28]|uniref:TraB/GumN family protein n=1 Tax=Ruegeria haliotis TaxID=2747601 RepID=A0ABX2PJS1_9RHOB|nr:TraB/GumN family protein [Ruegeria haliotis]NVO54373.1 TraB/GumN family protein [Ruegeria haliotis]
MRLLALLAFVLLPASVHAACEGVDLRSQMPSETKAGLQHALAGIPYPEGNHWVARKGNTVLHLIGTQHTSDPRMDAVVDRLTPTLSQADAFYFEVTQDEMTAFERALAQDLSPVMITSGPTLIDLMSEEDWTSLSTTLAERGIPSWMAAKMRPWFLSMMLGIPPCLRQNPDANRGMDARLTELAEAQGIPQFSLEKVEDLMAMFNSHPIEEQVQSLVRLSGALQSSEDQLTTMANAYMEEKHAQILQLARLQGLEESGLTPEEFDVEWDGFEQQLLVQRNANWMQHILDIKDQTAVIAVGAGHLSDDYGLLAQLHGAGYTLTRAPF